MDTATPGESIGYLDTRHAIGSSGSSGRSQWLRSRRFGAVRDVTWLFVMTDSMFGIIPDRSQANAIGQTMPPSAMSPRQLQQTAVDR